MRSFCLGDEADKWTDDHRLSSWLSPRVKIRILFFLFDFFFPVLSPCPSSSSLFPSRT